MSNKKNQILEASLALFLEKGFDKTSVSDILEHLNIARGTLYYHFESKEAIMDAIIEQAGEKIFRELETISATPDLCVQEKIFSLFSGMNMRRLSGGNQFVHYLNQPQNALFHEKSNRMILQKVSPLLAYIIKEGVEQKIFYNAFPEQTAEIILTAVIGFMDDRAIPEDESYGRLGALIYNVERMLGAEEGFLKMFKDQILY